MTRVDDYRETLRGLDDWDAFLLRKSRLPGPRGNIELARAVAEEGVAERAGLLLERRGRRASGDWQGDDKVVVHE